MSNTVTISRAAFERLHRAASDFSDDLISGMEDGTYDDPDNAARAKLLGEALRETALHLREPITDPHHIRIGARTWCEWLGSIMGQRIAGQANAPCCSYPSALAAQSAADRLAPHFRCTVAIASGPCPHAAD